MYVGIAARTFATVPGGSATAIGGQHGRRKLGRRARKRDKLLAKRKRKRQELNVATEGDTKWAAGSQGPVNADDASDGLEAAGPAEAVMAPQKHRDQLMESELEELDGVFGDLDIAKEIQQLESMTSEQAEEYLEQLTGAMEDKISLGTESDSDLQQALAGSSNPFDGFGSDSQDDNASSDVDEDVDLESIVKESQAGTDAAVGSDKPERPAVDWKEVVYGKKKHTANLQKQASTLNAKLKPTNVEGFLPSVRHARIEKTMTRALAAVFTSRLIKDPRLFPGGLPVEFVEVTLSPDLSRMTARWALPTPLAGKVKHVSKAWLAPGANTREEQSETRGYKMLFEPSLHSGVGHRDSWYQERSSRNARRKRPMDLSEEDTAHLSGDIAQQMQEVGAALQAHSSQIRRHVSHRVPLKFMPELIFRRYTEAERLEIAEQVLAEAQWRMNKT